MDDLIEKVREAYNAEIGRWVVWERRVLTTETQPSRETVYSAMPFPEKDGDEPAFTSDNLGKVHAWIERRAHRATFRVMLEGIREPDIAMVDAARTAGEKRFAEGREPTARTDFTAMIDHLREKLDD